MEVVTKSASETKKLGREMADQLTSGQLGSRTTKILALSGDLGSGKTTFVQGFAEGLGIKQQIISPTFILLRKYGNNFFHLDLYRLEENVEQEVKNLGIEDIWQDPNNIVVIEWAEKIKDMVPENSKWIKFENMGDNMRKIAIS